MTRFKLLVASDLHVGLLPNRVAWIDAVSSPGLAKALTMRKLKPAATPFDFGSHRAYLFDAIRQSFIRLRDAVDLLLFPGDLASSAEYYDLDAAHDLLFGGRSEQERLVGKTSLLAELSGLSGRSAA